MKSRFSQSKNGEGDQTEPSQIDELYTIPTPMKIKKKPLIAKEKKMFDSADYYMHGEEQSEESGGAHKEESFSDIVNPHRSKMTSVFAEREKTTSPSSDNEEESGSNDCIQEQASSPTLTKTEQVEELNKGIEKKSESEDKLLRDQEAALLSRKGGFPTKKPLVAKQKKVFDSADYYMNDEHGDEEKQETESTDISGASLQFMSKQKAFSSSQFAQAREDKSNEQHSNTRNLPLLSTGQHQEKISVTVPLINFFGSEAIILAPIKSEYDDDDVPVIVNVSISEDDTGKARKRPTLSSRSGSESRERKRVSFSLPMNELAYSQGNNNPQIIDENCGRVSSNQVHSLKGSRFLRLPHGSQVAEDQEKESKDVEERETRLGSYLDEVQNKNEFSESEVKSLNNEDVNYNLEVASTLISKKKKVPLIAKDKKTSFDSADYYSKDEGNKAKGQQETFPSEVVGYPCKQVIATEQAVRPSASTGQWGYFSKFRNEVFNKEDEENSPSSQEKVLKQEEQKREEEMHKKEEEEEQQQQKREESDVEQPHYMKINIVRTKKAKLSWIGADVRNRNCREPAEQGEEEQVKKYKDEKEECLMLNRLPIKETVETLLKELDFEVEVEEEENYLPVIKKSKITNSKFIQYRQQASQESENEEDRNTLLYLTISQQQQQQEQQQKQQQQEQEEQTDEKKFVKKSGFAGQFSKENEEEVEEEDEADSASETVQLYPSEIITHKESEELMRTQSANISKAKIDEHDAFSIPLPIPKKKKNLLNKEKKKEFDSADYFMK